MIEHVEKIWREPDDGIWETRGPRRDFTQSKVMAWVVFDRAVRLAEGFGLDAPLERWKRTRDEIHHEICERGYDPVRGTFTQYYGSAELDASVLLIPLVGFLPPTTGSPPRSTRSGTNSVATASCPGIPRRTPTTGFRETKASSWPARSGW
nr:glycoside hydrolase family 15 protein [Rhodococcus pyridinivorans]